MRILRKHNVPFDTWDGDGGTRTLDRLVESIEMGEIDIQTMDNGDLVLHVHVSVVTLRHYQRKKGYFELREHRRVSSNGHFSPREFSGSLGGKIRRYESPLKAAQRELAEELGNSEPGFRNPNRYVLTRMGEEVLGPQPSDGRPGLQDIYHRHHFKCDIDNELYRHAYIERHEGKEERHFYWVKV